MITEPMLRQLWPHGDSKVPGLVAGIAVTAQEVFAKYGFASDVEIAQAMAQFSHECGAGTEMTENIHYTAERAVQVWPHRFNSVNDCYNKIGSFPGDPDFPGKLIDSVYGTRMGNRPGTHDGRNYIGRGLAQTTGHDGYKALGDKMGRDLLNRPGDVNRPDLALECGVADFVICGCLPFAKKDDTLNVTKRLNGGTVGLAERQQWLVKWKHALATPTPTLRPPAPPQHSVQWTQHALNMAGFGPLREDGVNGPLTIAALKRFQNAQRLTPDGIVGPQDSKTSAALESEMLKGLTT